MHHYAQLYGPKSMRGSISPMETTPRPRPCAEPFVWRESVEIIFSDKMSENITFLLTSFLELFWKMSPDRMCENQGKARIKNPWINNPHTKRWCECLRTKAPVARHVWHAWISGADDKKPVRGWWTMTKPTQGKLNSQLQISGTFLGVTKLGSYLPARKQLSCSGQEQGKAVYYQVGIPTWYSMPQEDKRYKDWEEK